MNSEAQAGGAVGDVEVSRRWSDGGRSRMNSEAQAGGAVGDVEVTRRWSDGGRSPMDGEAQAGGAVGDVEVSRRWSDGGRSPMNADEARVVELCDDLLAKLDPKSTPHAEFLGAQYDLGLA